MPLPALEQGTPGTEARRYCGRTGAVVMLRDGQTCIECGTDRHVRLAILFECGCFAECGDHGHPCQLAVGHTGRHKTVQCREAK